MCIRDSHIVLEILFKANNCDHNTLRSYKFFNYTKSETKPESKSVSSEKKEKICATGGYVFYLRSKPGNQIIVKKQLTQKEKNQNKKKTTEQEKKVEEVIAIIYYKHASGIGAKFRGTLIGNCKGMEATEIEEYIKEIENVQSRFNTQSNSDEDDKSSDGEKESSDGEKESSDGEKES